MEKYLLNENWHYFLEKDNIVEIEKREDNDYNVHAKGTYWILNENEVNKTFRKLDWNEFNEIDKFKLN